MSVKKGERRLRIHCPQHGNLFDCLEARVILCEADKHTLAHNFPFEDWWEFCCGCQYFWPSDGGHRGRGREECPACGRPVAVRYLCHRCMVLSNAPESASKGRGFRISVAGRVEPCCPACFSPAPPVLDHQCAGARTPFMTARSSCPFCEEILWEESALDEEQIEVRVDETPAAPTGDAAAGAEGSPDPALERADEEGLSLPSPQEDAPEVWPRRESVRAAGESDIPAWGMPYQYDSAQESFFQSGLPRDAPPDLGGGASPEFPAQHTQPTEAAAGAGTRERPAVTSDGEPATAAALHRTQRSPNGTSRGGSRDGETFASFETGGRHSAGRGRVWARGALLAGAGVAALLILALLLSRPPADAGTRKGADGPPAGGAASGAGEATSPLPPPPSTMVFMEGGEFTMGRDGSSDPFEQPAHKVWVAPFLIGAHEVTRAEYARFVEEKRHKPPPDWQDGRYPPGTGQRPVTGVTWDDANAYARWAGKRLPTEQEWEFAARGLEGRLYPWGNEWREGAANIGHEAGRGPSDVGSSAGATPEGVYDLIGNVWEWTKSELKPYPGGRLPRLPPGELKVIRGGSWRDEMNITGTYRAYLRARGSNDYSGTGFRCAQDAPAGARQQ